MTRDLPPLNALRAFEAAARRLSFTAASEELHVTQGAVSRHVKNLENRLGVRLFHRRSHGLELTDAALRYLPVVRDSFDRLAAATAELRRPQLASVLTVSASPNFASKWLVHRLGAFAHELTDIDLRVAAEQQHIDLSTSDVDIGIRHGDGSWKDLHVTKLVGERVYPVISPALLANGPPLDTPDDLRHYTLLRDLSSNDWPAWLKAAGATGVDGTRGPYFNFTSMALDAAVAGQGVALARRALATHDVLSGRLVPLFETELRSQRGYFIVCLPSRADEPKIVRFREWILEQTRQDRMALAELRQRLKLDRGGEHHV